MFPVERCTLLDEGCLGAMGHRPQSANPAPLKPSYMINSLESTVLLEYSKASFVDRQTTISVGDCYRTLIRFSYFQTVLKVDCEH